MQQRLRRTSAKLTMTRLQKDLVFSEIKPIIDGPGKKPNQSPCGDHLQNPQQHLTPGILAAALNNMGTIQQQPNPIII